MSDNNVNEQEAWIMGEGREWLRGRHKNPNASAWEHAVDIGHPRLRRLYTKFKAAYERKASRGELPEGMPASFDDTRVAKDIRRIDGTEQYARAVQDGDAGRVRSMVGSTEKAQDISGMDAMLDLLDILDETAFMSYLWGHPGKGKTDFAFLIAQYKQHLVPEIRIATNVRSASRDNEDIEWIRNFGELDEWLKQDPSAPKLFIFDEASSHASGRGAQGYETASKLGPLLYKIRKYSGSLIIIGHDGKDVHPSVRELAYGIHKTGKKNAVIYHTVENRKGRDKIQEVTGINPTQYTFDTDEVTEWSWSSDVKSEDDLEREAMRLAEEIAEDEAEDRVKAELMEIARSMRREGHSLRCVAEYLPVSRQTVSDWTDDVDTPDSTCDCQRSS